MTSGGGSTDVQGGGSRAGARMHGATSCNGGVDPPMLQQQPAVVAPWTREAAYLDLGAWTAARYVQRHGADARDGCAVWTTIVLGNFIS